VCTHSEIQKREGGREGQGKGRGEEGGRERRKKGKKGGREGGKEKEKKEQEKTKTTRRNKNQLSWKRMKKKRNRTAVPAEPQGEFGALGDKRGSTVTMLREAQHWRGLRTHFSGLGR
jgi:hypothetical protein